MEWQKSYSTEHHNLLLYTSKSNRFPTYFIYNVYILYETIS